MSLTTIVALTAIEKRALEVVTLTRTGITAAELGIMLWQGDRRISARSTSSNRWARPAGKIMKRLERYGLAHCSLKGRQFRWFPR